MRRDALRQPGDGKPPIGPVLDLYGVHYVPNHAGYQPILCPVHDESRPSCTVNLDECHWTCHACGEHGDVFDLVMLKEGCDFQTARRRVAEITGTGDPDVPGGAVRLSRSSVLPDQPGYQPRFRRAVPAGVRYRTGPRL